MEVWFMSHGPTVECANRLDFFREHAGSCGWSPGPADLGIARELYVSPKKLDMQQHIGRRFEHDPVYAFTQRATNPRLRAIDQERFKVRSYDYLTAVDSPFQGASMTVAGYRSGQFLAGTPEEPIEAIVQQQEATGAGVLVVRSEVGSVGLPEALEGLELFARRAPGGAEAVADSRRGGEPLAARQPGHGERLPSIRVQREVASTV